MAAADCPKPSASEETFTFLQLTSGKAFGKGARGHLVKITGPNQYKNDGSAIDLSSICPSKVMAVIPCGPMYKDTDKSDAYLIGWLPGSGPTNGKIIAYRQTAATGALAEVPDATVDMSGYRAYLYVIGY